MKDKTTKTRRKIMSHVKLLDVCPECGNVTKYYPNPMYTHKCEHCQSSYLIADLITAVDADALDKEIKKLQQLKQKFPNVHNGQLVLVS